MGMRLARSALVLCGVRVGHVDGVIGTILPGYFIVHLRLQRSQSRVILPPS